MLPPDRGVRISSSTQGERAPRAIGPSTDPLAEYDAGVAAATSAAERAAWQTMRAQAAKRLESLETHLAASRAAARLAARVAHPKIHAADVPDRVRVDSAEGWFPRARARILSERAAGDPRAASLIATMVALQWHRAVQGNSAKIRVSFVELGRRAGLCADTARRCIRWLERADLLDTANVLVRGVHKGAVRLLRDANLYLIRPAADPPPPAAQRAAAAPPAASPTPAGRAAATIARWGRALGLALRPAGWNTTPVAPDSA